jgi:hypothetical protein
MANSRYVTINTTYYNLSDATASALHAICISMCYVLLSHTPQEEWRGEIEQLSWKPRAFLAKGFLSDEEADHIINMVSVGWGVRVAGGREVPPCCFCIKMHCQQKQLQQQL